MALLTSASPQPAQRQTGYEATGSQRNDCTALPSAKPRAPCPRTSYCDEKIPSTSRNSRILFGSAAGDVMEGRSPGRVELARLRKARFSDLALRPERYRWLTDQASAVLKSPLPLDYPARVEFLGSFIAAVCLQLPTTPAFDAALRELFAIGINGSADLATRRRRSSKAFDGKDRAPDSFYNYPEPVIDNAVIEAISGLVSDARVSLGSPEPERIALEQWDRDLELCRSLIDRQDFSEADRLLGSYLRTHAQLGPDASDALRGLRASTFMLAGDSSRDQGITRGQQGARRRYHQAFRAYSELGRSHRAALAELMLAVCDEMDGEHSLAAHSYLHLSTSVHALLPYDVARATLWVGTAVSKTNEAAEAIPYIHRAIAGFSELGRQSMVGNAYQKLALTELASGRPQAAQAAFDLAAQYSDVSTPLSSIRFRVAKAHIMSGVGDIQSALTILDDANRDAEGSGLGHQLLAISRIRRTILKTG